nr:glycosyltransferase [Ramlibacter algicola]
MEAALRRRFPAARIEVVPFVDDELFEALARTPLSANPPYTGGVATFFYPAELVGHKNHATLVQAWSLLQDRGCTARLQLTLRPEEEELLARECPQLRSLAAVTNLGRLTRAQVLDTMRGSSALLFASRAETFGLPLLEATAHQVPVLAAERDFVRDVCAPAQTFDPESARSIADAVQRFLQQGQAGGIQVESAASVVRRLLAA